MSDPALRLEVIVARGRCPSRQRNRAVAAASGEYILFLDDDSEVSSGLLLRYLQVLEGDPRVAAVGGPAGPAPAGSFAAVAALTLGEPWVVGKSASRYRSRGRRRLTDERELILCNLCLRREAFERAGGFDERLYPNEENRLLEALKSGGLKLVHDPAATVRRVHRSNLGDYLGSIRRYGAGRGTQLRCGWSRVSSGRFCLSLIALLSVLLGIWGMLDRSAVLLFPVGLYGVYSLALLTRLSRRAGFKKGLLATALAGLTHIVYASGVVAGVLSPVKRLGEAEVTITREALVAGAGDG